VGELMDKITILQIKSERIADPAKLANVNSELEALIAVCERLALDRSALDAHVVDLKDVNRRLWTLEDDVRECEAHNDFGDYFIALARSVYRLNDERARLKKAINLAYGSRYVEEKSYKST
jgi:hypothetical protein